MSGQRVLNTSSQSHVGRQRCLWRMNYFAALSSMRHSRVEYGGESPVSGPQLAVIGHEAANKFRPVDIIMKTDLYMCSKCSMCSSSSI